jgi:outer membrane receptor protein involved in Fe transport
MVFYLQQEFVYVGDAELPGKTRRMGADLGLRYQLNDWLYFDANYTYARDRQMGKTTSSCARTSRLPV